MKVYVYVPKNGSATSVTVHPSVESFLQRFLYNPEHITVKWESSLTAKVRRGGMVLGKLMEREL